MNIQADVTLFNITFQIKRQMQSMSTPRIGHCLAYRKGVVFALGGSQGDNVMRSCEKFTVQRNEWKEMSPMINERVHASA